MTSVLALCCIMGSAMAKDTVVVYTALENDEIVRYLALAKEQLPDLDIKAIRLSTGELGARILAEKQNPQGGCDLGMGRYQHGGVCGERHAHALQTYELG